MKKILAAVLGLAAIVLIAGMIVPADFRVEREIVINKPNDFVFNQLKLLKNHNQWSPWAKKDPNMTMQYDGIDGTVGFVTAWSGNKEVGIGQQRIMFIEEGKKIETELYFKEPMEDTCRAYFMTESTADNQTRVRWGMTGNTPFPGNLICLLMNMQDKLGKDFEEGLNNLKVVLEKS